MKNKFILIFIFCLTLVLLREGQGYAEIYKNKDVPPDTTLKKSYSNCVGVNYIIDRIVGKRKDQNGEYSIYFYEKDVKAGISYLNEHPIVLFKLDTNVWLFKPNPEAAFCYVMK